MADKLKHDNHQKTFAIWLEHHPIYVVFLFLAAITTVLFGIVRAIQFFEVSESPVLIKKMAAVPPSIVSELSDSNQTTMGHVSLSERLPTLLNSTSSISNLVTNMVESLTNYLFTIGNASDYRAYYCLKILGKWGPTHKLRPHGSESYRVESSDVDVWFDDSALLGGGDRYVTIYASPVLGRLVTEDDWSNAPCYYFQMTKYGYLDLFESDN
jgi:hypothetical protein